LSLKQGFAQLLLGVLLPACYPSGARGPEPVKPIAIDCIAAPWWFVESSGYRLWPEAKWQSGQDTVPRSGDYVAEHLKGSYRLFVATSEGEGAKWIAEWSLKLEPTPAAQDSAWRNRWVHGKRGVHFPLVGRMEYRRGGYINGDRSLAPATGGWTPSADSVRLRYEPAAGIMRLDGAPFDALDAGTPYAIYAIDSAGGFSGRWTTGGFEMAIIPTPLGTIGEQSAGYFCARRDSSR